MVSDSRKTSRANRQWNQELLEHQLSKEDAKQTNPRVKPVCRQEQEQGCGGGAKQVKNGD